MWRIRTSSGYLLIGLGHYSSQTPPLTKHRIHNAENGSRTPPATEAPFTIHSRRIFRIVEVRYSSHSSLCKRGFRASHNNMRCYRHLLFTWNASRWVSLMYMWPHMYVCISTVPGYVLRFNEHDSKKIKTDLRNIKHTV